MTDLRNTMTNIILDTNIIILYPKILGLQIPEIHFIVPIDVISELNSRATQKGKSFDDRVDLIEKSASEGTVSILNTDLPGFKRYFDLVNYNRIAGADYSLIAVALNFQERGEIVKIATLDKEVQNIAGKHNLEVLNKEEIENLISSFKEPTEKIPFSKKVLEILLTLLGDTFPLFPVLAT